MPLQFRASREEDLPGIVRLMQAAFEAAEGAPFLDTALLRWKYFEPNAEWGDRTRSYVLAREGELLAHGCAWPVRPGVACLIDWVSAKTAPGMGIMLARSMGQLTPVLLSIGGSEMTQKIMPKIGFAKRGELITAARVVRPWRQFRTRPGPRDGKAVLRLVRNLGWSMAQTALTRGWIAAERTLPHYEFLVRCPGARVRSYELRRLDRARGSLLLSRVGGQSRMAELEIDSDDPEDWASAYAAAVEAARRDAEACEVIALAHDGGTRAALLANGFVERMRRSVFVSDPGRTLAPRDFPLRLNMLADDLFYLNTPEYPYLT